MGNLLAPRLIVAGSRTAEDRGWIYACLDRWVDLNDWPIVVLTGGAPGADRIGAEWAHQRGITTETFAAYWHTHGRAAGPIRNAQMAMAGTHLVVFWDGQSLGTKDMIAKAEKRSLPVKRYPLSDPEPAPAQGRTAPPHSRSQ